MTPRDIANLSPEFFELIEAMCEDRLDPTGAQRLEQIVLRDANARRAYLAYLDLHGTLHWNTAFGTDGANFEPAISPRLAAESDAERDRSTATRDLRRLLIVAACVVIVAAFSFSAGRWFVPNNDQPSLAKDEQPTANRSEDPKSDDPTAVVQRTEETSPSQPVMLTDRPKSGSLPAEATCRRCGTFNQVGLTRAL